MEFKELGGRVWTVFVPGLDQPQAVFHKAMKLRLP